MKAEDLKLNREYIIRYSSSSKVFKAKVIEITETTILYKNLDDKDSSDSRISNDIFNLNYIVMEEMEESEYFNEMKFHKLMREYRCVPSSHPEKASQAYDNVIIYIKRIFKDNN